MNPIVFFVALFSVGVYAEPTLVRFPPPGKVEGPKQFRITEYTTLSEISMFLYGTLKMIPELAKSNGLEPPYRTIQQNSLLSLPKAPFLTEEQGLVLMQRMWTKQRCASLKRIYQEGVDERTCVILKPKIEDQTQPSVVSNQYQEWKAKRRETLDAAVVEKKQAIEDIWLKSQQWMSTAHFAEAEVELSRLVEMEPESPRGWLGLIHAQVRGDSAGKAKSTACEMVRRFPKLKSLHFVRSLTAENCGEAAS